MVVELLESRIFPQDRQGHMRGRKDLNVWLWQEREDPRRQIVLPDLNKTPRSDYFSKLGRPGRDNFFSGDRPTVDFFSKPGTPRQLPLPGEFSVLVEGKNVMPPPGPSQQKIKVPVGVSFNFF